MGIKLGFTGTRTHMTHNQMFNLAIILEDYKNKFLISSIEEFHNGCCEGSDNISNYIIKAISPLTKIHWHPPIDKKYVKKCYVKPDIVYKDKPYLERNKCIVDKTEHLIAIPKGFNEEVRSGTWATIRYARLKKKPIIIIFPDGKIKKENFNRGLEKWQKKK